MKSFLGTRKQRIFILLIALASLFLINYVSALDSLGTFKQNTNVRVSQVCADATYITISISNPDSTIAVTGINMTNNGGEFNYTFTSTSQIGRYDVRGISDGCEKSFAVYFDVTPSGNANNSTFYYLIFIVSLGVMVLGFAIKNGWIAILGSFGLVYLGLYIILYGINGVKDTVYTWGFGIILLAVAGYVGVKSAFEMVEDV